MTRPVELGFVEAVPTDVLTIGVVVGPSGAPEDPIGVVEAGGDV